MSVLKAFQKGWGIYKKNLSALLLLNAFRIFAVISFTIAALLFSIPFVISGFSQFLVSPDVLLTTPGLMEAAAYFFSYIFALAALAFLVFPWFLYPHLAGAVIALKKPVKLEQAFKSVKNNYFKLMLDTLVYWSIVLFLMLQSMFLIIASPFLGVLLLIVTSYVSVRLTFWDTLIFMGEKQPLMASWNLTKKNFSESLFFVLVSNLVLQACLIIGNLGIVFCFLVTPLVATSKAVFVSSMRKGFNKKRRKK